MCNWVICQMHAREICNDIIKHLLKSGYRYQVTKKDIEKAIIETRNCVDERTIDRWFRALVTFEYIKPMTPMTQTPIFKINFEKMPNEIVKTLNEQPQTKLQ